MEPDDQAVGFAHRMFDLARDGSTDELSAYLDAGVPATLTNESGDALLMLAAYNGHPDTVGMLLERGAEANQVNDRGQTPLAAAVVKRSADSVRHLLEHGADPDAGSPSARATAEFFDLPDMAALLR
jgi:ankyrin repeat protein